MKKPKKHVCWWKPYRSFDDTGWSGEIYCSCGAYKNEEQVCRILNRYERLKTKKVKK